jgi:hypothetical protein
MVKIIENRHQLNGQSIKFADSFDVPGPATIYGNHITGGAQGGIFSAVIGTTIHDNVIEHNGTYTNDFGIYAWANGGEVYNNVLAPITGRGINIASSKGERVHDNQIEVIEEKVNEEYAGCQYGGTFGIQFDDDPHEAIAFRNSVVAKASECDAQALRVTDSRKGSKNLSHHNRYIAKRLGRSLAFATGFGSGGATEFVSEHDTFVGDTSAVRFDWDGGQNLIFRECVFEKGPNAAPDYATFSFRNGGKVPITNIHFIDSIFQNGASKDSTDMRPVLDAGDWPGPAEYFIDWTFRLCVRDHGLKPVSGATIDITDALGNSVFQGITNQEGSISTVLTEFRMYNTSTVVQKEEHSPYLLHVKKAGCGPSFKDLVLPMTKMTEQALLIDCPSTETIPRN